MRHKTDFPALSQTISTINRIAADSDESAQTLSAALLKGFRADQQAVAARQFFDLQPVRRHHQHDLARGDDPRLRRRALARDHADPVRAYAKQGPGLAAQGRRDRFLFHRHHRAPVAGLCGVPDSEEGFICGVFHHLGKLLAGYYFYDESAEIAKRVQKGDPTKRRRAPVLGISHEELGIGIARSWNLPEKIVHSMQHLSSAQALKFPNPGDKLKIVANLASELCRIASETSPSRKTQELEQLGRDSGGQPQPEQAPVRRQWSKRRSRNSSRNPRCSSTTRARAGCSSR
jgi:hypothetical protein